MRSLFVYANEPLGHLGVCAVVPEQQTFQGKADGHINSGQTSRFPIFTLCLTGEHEPSLQHSIKSYYGCAVCIFGTLW